MEAKKVEIYSTPTCHWCAATKEFFKANNVEFTNYNVAEEPDRRKEMIEKSGQMGVPVIFINNDMIIGYDEERLRELLGLPAEAPAAA